MTDRVKAVFATTVYRLLPGPSLLSQALRFSEQLAQPLGIAFQKHSWSCNLQLLELMFYQEATQSRSLKTKQNPRRLRTQTLLLEPLRNEPDVKDSRAFTILSQESCFPFTVGLSLSTFSPNNITKCLKRSKI